MTKYSYQYNSRLLVTVLWEWLQLLQEKLSTGEMATLTWNCIDDSEDILENFGLEETIWGSRNENINYIISKTGVNLHMIRLEDKIVFTVSHEVHIHVCLLTYIHTCID